MTDQDAIEAALSAVDASSRDHVLIRRNGRFFMALPANRSAATRALDLYQPQRPKAVLAMLGIRLLAITGLHRIVLPVFQGVGGRVSMDPEFRDSLPGTTGVMLGSPEHPVRRAILSYRTSKGWEVAKTAFGEEGRTVIDGEYAALVQMPAAIPGIPRVLGTHHGQEISILRLPYIHGRPLGSGEDRRAVDLLGSWFRNLPAKPASEFPEWPAIQSALETSDQGVRALNRLAAMQLSPVIRHGDFARWNLLETTEHELMAIDWEWGHNEGMPGLDLAHLFMQDSRLVKRLSPMEVITKTRELLKRPACAQYLIKCGWSEDTMLPIIASLAWKQGAAHQDNAEILGIALAALSKCQL